MSTSAIIFMIISMVLIWGGLLFSIVHLKNHPDIPMNQLPDDQIQYERQAQKRKVLEH